MNISNQFLFKITLFLFMIFTFSVSFEIKTGKQLGSTIKIQSHGVDPSYNLAQSKDYAIFAVTAYCDKKCVDTWSCPPSNNYLSQDKVINVTYFMGTVTRASGYTAYDQTKNLIVISLRGSSNIENWISDFSFDAVDFEKCKDCKVHVGFMEDYKSIQQKLSLAVDKLIKAYPNASILATGHSLGGALSVIVGIQLKLKFPTRFIQIHNIGCPRVGNANFAQFVHLKINKINRVIHNRDIVPHLPPIQFGYHHSAYQIFFDKGMQNYEICNQSGQDPKCSNKFFPDYDAGDHDFYFWDLQAIKQKC